MVKKILKWFGIILGGLVALVVLAAVVLYITGRVKFARKQSAAGALVLTTPPDSAALARGRQIVATRGCQECHGERLEGKIFLDIPPAYVVPSNLTPGRGGVGRRYSLAHWDAAVRFGVRPDGTALNPFMPYHQLNSLDDNDAAALAGYLERLPPVDNELPASRLKILGYVILGVLGTGHDDLDRTRRVVPVETTARYGEYVASTTCVVCHGKQLGGGTPPDPSSPPAPSLLGYAAMPTEALTAVLRNGTVPDGRRVNNAMPWRRLQYLSDVEIGALHEYIKDLASRRPST